VKYEGNVAVAPPEDRLAGRLRESMLWILAFFVFSLPLLTPWPLTLALSVTAITPRSRPSAAASLADSLIARPWISGSRLVTRPWCLRTSARAFFSAKAGLNCAMASTLRDGAFLATVARACGAAAWADAATLSESSATTAMKAVTSALRERSMQVLDNSGHLLVPHSKRFLRSWRPSYLSP